MSKLFTDDEQVDTYVTIVRHGQTHWNNELRLQGWKDEEGCQLTKKGLLQARSLGARFERENAHFDVVYSSDLGRALTTMQLAVERLNIKPSNIKIDKRFRERSFGKFEAITKPLLTERFSREWSRMKTGDPSWKPEGGESANEVQLRAWEALMEIVAKNRGKSILLVSHGGTISLLLQQILNMPSGQSGKLHIKNTSVSTAIFDEDNVATLTSMGDDSHTKMLPAVSGF